MERYDYETVTMKTKGFLGGKLDDSGLRNQLKAMGQQGWELVEILTTAKGFGESHAIVCVFKRKIS